MNGQLAFDTDKSLSLFDELVEESSIIEKSSKVDSEAPDFVKNAWRKAKQDRIREFKKKQALPYDEKLERQAEIAWSYYERLQEMKLGAHVSVGGLDSITLYVWLLSIGIDVPAISVRKHSLITDATTSARARSGAAPLRSSCGMMSFILLRRWIPGITST